MNSILERVNQVCQIVRDTSSNPVSFKKLIAKTRKLFKAHDFDLAIKTKKDKSLEASEFYVMAYYDAEDDAENETPIEVIVYHCFQDDDKFNEIQKTELLIQIYDAVVHEFKHRQQSVKRKYRLYSNNDHSPYKQYLKDPDELDAYALSIAIELARSIGVYRAKRNLTRISLLSKMRQDKKFTSPNLNAYMCHFGLDNVTKKLAKKVYIHLETLDSKHIFM